MLFRMRGKSKKKITGYQREDEVRRHRMYIRIRILLIFQ